MWLYHAFIEFILERLSVWYIICSEIDSRFMKECQMI